MIVEEDDKYWDVEGIMTAKNAEASALRGKMHVLLEQSRSANVEVPSDMLGVIALAERCLDLKVSVTKQEQALVEVEQKLHIASSAGLSRQHSALAKAKEVC